MDEKRNAIKMDYDEWKRVKKAKRENERMKLQTKAFYTCNICWESPETKLKLLC